MNRPEQITSNQQERKKDILHRSVAALSAVGVAVLAACGPNAEAQSPAPAPAETTVSAETPAPVETTETEPAPITLEQIPGDLPYGELAQATADMTSEWQFAGATEETIDETQQLAHDIATEWEDKAYNTDELYAEVALRNADALTAAYFPENWESIEGAVKYRQELINMNAEAINVNMLRYLNNEELTYLDRQVVVEESKEQFDETVGENERRISYVTLVTPQNSINAPFKQMTTKTFDISTGSALLVGEATNNL